MRMKLKLHLAHAFNHAMMPCAFPEIHMSYVSVPPPVALDVLEGIIGLIKPSRARHTTRVSSNALLIKPQMKFATRDRALMFVSHRHTS